MMKLILKCLAISGLVLGAITAQTQELKIGYVNLDKVLRDAAPAKVAQSKLRAEFGRRDKDLVELEERLKAASEKYDKEAMTMADSERTRRQRELIEQDREFQRKRREYQEDLNQRQNEEVASILERANRVVKQIAEQEKYDLIVQEAVYVSPRVDITDKVVRALNVGPAK